MQFVESGLAAARQEAAAAALTGSTSSTDSNDSQHDSQHELSADLLRLTSVALTGPAAAALPIVMAINVLRNVAYLTDAWITKFNPVLPNEWLGEWPLAPALRMVCVKTVPNDTTVVSWFHDTEAVNCPCLQVLPSLAAGSTSPTVVVVVA